MQKEVFCPEFSRLWLWFLCGPSLKMCCPFLPVTSPHCDMRPRGGGNSKDNHKDGQAAVGQTGGKIYGKGSWLPAASLEIRSKRLRKLCFSWHAFLSRTSSPRAPLCCCLQGISACTADVWGSPAFFTRLFFYQEHPFTEDLCSGSMGMGTSQVLLSWDSSCPMLSCVCRERQGAWCLPPPGGTVRVQSEPR